MDQNRTPAGVPTGGRFAQQTHSEAEVDIDDDLGTTTGSEQSVRVVDRYDMNDTLVRILSDHGSTLGDDELNDLTHQVSDLIDQAMNKGAMSERPAG